MFSSQLWKWFSDNVMINNLQKTKNETKGNGFLTANVSENNVIINLLHNNIRRNELVPSEVQSTLLCSNNFVSDCTSLGGKVQNEIENKSAKQLAEIIFNLWQKQLKLNTTDLPTPE